MKPKITKSVAVIGEGQTEWFYFDSLRVACHYPFRIVPGLPQHSDIGHIIKLVESKIKEEYDYVFVVVDVDRLLENAQENRLYMGAKANYSQGKYVDRVLFFETNPCTEFWFLLHFLPNLTQKQYSSSDQLIQELREYMPGYEKTKRYFTHTNLYKYLTENGDIERAVRNSEKLCKLVSDSAIEDKIAYSQIHRLILKLNAILSRTQPQL